MQKTVYIDMDGTLANFDKMAEKFVGFNGRDFKNLEKEFMSPEQRARQNLLFKAIDENPHFFKYEEPYPFAKQLYYECKKIFDKVSILSNYVPPKDKFSNLYEVRVHKTNWIWEHIDPTIPCSDVIITNMPKYWYATEYSWLIDDMIKNINMWKNAGGNAILFTDWKSVYQKLQLLKKGRIR